MTEPPDFPPKEEELEFPAPDDQATGSLTEDETSSSHARQDRMIVALLDHLTQEKAAALGISPVTLWRQMQKPDFAAAFRQARRQAVSLAVARLPGEARRLLEEKLDAVRLRMQSAIDSGECEEPDVTAEEVGEMLHALLEENLIQREEHAKQTAARRWARESPAFRRTSY